MALRIIRKNDDPVLYKVCKEVRKFDARLAELIDDMIETMNDADGVGLAAPQVGVLKRVAVIDVGDGPIELVNPVILDSAGEQGGMEGCLSFPGESGYVVRPNWVKVEAYDRNGDLYEYEGEGLFARAVFHETDHLDGKVYLRLKTEPPKDFKE
jgi:peptide deformylase